MGSRLACRVLVAIVLLAGGEAWAAERWYVAQSGHFIVIGNGGVKQVREVAREMEQLRAVFQSLLNLRVESGKPLLVLAADDEKTMRRLVPRYWARRGGMHPGGLFMSGEEKDWAVLRADLPQPTRVIYHEYAHLLTRLSLGPLPVWLNEGLAELFGSTELRENDVRIGEVDPGHLALLKDHLPLPIDRLVSVDYGSADYTEGDRVSEFYAESAILTHYLLLADNASHRPRLNEFLRLREEGMSDRDALDHAFLGAEVLEAELRQYVRRLQYTFIKLPATGVAAAIPARELRPAEADAFLADFMLHTGELKAAGAYVADALHAEPTLGYAHLQRGSQLVALGRREEATAAFAEARRLAPRDALTHYRFGTLGQAPLADAAEREEALRTAIRVGPSFAPARGALARLLLDERHSPDEALELAASAVKLDPDSVANRITLLDLEDAMGCPEAARRDEDGLLRVVATDVEALAALVRHYDLDDRPAKAEAVLRRVHAQGPRNLFAMTMLAALLQRQGRPEEGEAVLRDGLALEPHSEMLLNSLAYLNAERGVKLVEALALADQALKLTPGAADVLDTKAWVLFRLGRLGEAEEFARKALDAREDPTELDHLGDILEKLGRLDAALTAWKQALANDNATAQQRESLTAKIAGAEKRQGAARQGT